MAKVFALRIDIESDKGIKKGIPKILDLLKKYRIKASFYLTMGGESSLRDLIRYRKKMAGERRIKVFSKLEMLRMALFPRDFVGKNRAILGRIIKEGHELGIHGWKHRAWTRGIDRIDAGKHVRMAKKRYKKIFGKEAVTFAAPGYVTSKRIIKLLDKEGFKVISDLRGSRPRKIPGTGIINVPVTINGPHNSPIIESLASRGLNDGKILEILKKKIQDKKLSVIYGHDMFECIQKIGLLGKLFKFLVQSHIKVKTLGEIAK